MFKLIGFWFYFVRLVIWGCNIMGLIYKKLFILWEMILMFEVWLSLWKDVRVWKDLI